jgi:hypothetical protein
MGHYVRDITLFNWNISSVIILLLYVLFEHPRHTYGDFGFIFSKLGYDTLLLPGPKKLIPQVPMRLNANIGLTQGHKSRHMQDPWRSQVKQLQTIGLEQGVEKPMWWHTKSSLIKSRAHHDVPLHLSGWSDRKEGQHFGAPGAPSRGRDFLKLCIWD